MIAHYQQWRVSPYNPRIPASPSWKPRSLHFSPHLYSSSHCLLMVMDSKSDGHQSPAPPTAASPPQSPPDQQPPLSKRAQKKLLKQQRFEAKKAEKKAQLKEHKQKEAERKRKEWAERLAGMSEEEKLKLIEERKSVRRERMEKRSEEKGKKIERLTRAKESGQNFVIDLEFSNLMTSNELQSLVQQVSSSNYHEFC